MCVRDRKTASLGRTEVPSTCKSPQNTAVIPCCCTSFPAFRRIWILRRKRWTLSVPNYHQKHKDKKKTRITILRDSSNTRSIKSRFKHPSPPPHYIFKFLGKKSQSAPLHFKMWLLPISSAKVSSKPLSLIPPDGLRVGVGRTVPARSASKHKQNPTRLLYLIWEQTPSEGYVMYIIVCIYLCTHAL